MNAREISEGLTAAESAYVNRLFLEAGERFDRQFDVADFVRSFQAAAALAEAFARCEVSLSSDGRASTAHVDRWVEQMRVAA